LITAVSHPSDVYKNNFRFILGLWVPSKEDAKTSQEDGFVLKEDENDEASFKEF